jgi:hypothetical protein
MTLNIEPTVSEAPYEREVALRDLIEALDLPDRRLTTSELEKVALAVAARPDLFEDLVVADEESRWWLLLYKTEAFEVKLLTWERDQSSDWHDHGGSSGVFAVTAGTLVERHRASDAVGIESSRFDAGSFGSFGPDHVHDVVFGSGKPAVSIHAYSPPLVGLTYYEHTPFGFVAREFVPEEVRSGRRTTQPSPRD